MKLSKLPLFLAGAVGLVCGLPAHAQTFSIPYELNSNFNTDETFDEMNLGSDTPNAVGPNTTWSVMVGGTEYNTTLLTKEFSSGLLDRGYNTSLSNTPFATDRWLGIYGGGYMTAVFQNNTGGYLTSADLTYSAGLFSALNLASAAANSAGTAVWFSTDNTSWTQLNSSMFNATLTNATVTSTDAHGYITSGAVEATDIGGVFTFPTSVANGGVFYLRFDTANGISTPAGYTNADLGIAINDLQLSEVPEPAVYMSVLASLGIGALLWTRRRQVAAA